MKSDPPLPRGSTIAGRYRLISTLGEGGMGIAYRAWDIQAGVPVVVKVPKRALLDNPQFVKRFAREIRTMAAVQHPHIVPIVDFGEDCGGEFSGLPYVAMRFLPGGSLAHRRLRDADGKPLPNHPSTLYLWLPSIASALDTIHAAGIVHRDVKPANVFFDGFWHAFLGDFGIAKLLNEAGLAGREETLTGTNVGMGTPDFMSPEQFSPKAVVDGRADQYALAVTVYEMLCGSKPFTGQATHIAVEHLTLPPPLLASRCGGLPPSLCAAVHRGLAKRPAERFPSCTALVSAVLADVKPMEPERDVVRLLCPACSNILKLPLTAGGRTGKCPRCQNVMNVANDLGALWLEREAEGAAGGSGRFSRPISALTPVSGTTPVPPDDVAKAGPRVDPLVVRVGVAAGAMTLLVVWQLLSSHFAEERRKTQLSIERREQASLDQTVVDRERMADEIARLKSERQEMLRENQRLNAELAKANEEKTALKRRAAVRDAAATVAAVSPMPRSETVRNSVGMQLVRIAKGSFTMGSPSGEHGRADDESQVEVTITRDFLLGSTEVTQRQWKDVMDTTPWANSGVQADDDHPAVNVSWEDAVKFCETLTRRERADGSLGPNEAYRLPTEAEWEYACRAGTTTAYSCGDDEATLGNFAWFSWNADNVTHAVGIKQPNPWGLHDMHGNVWEWCSDWYDPKLVGGLDPTGAPAGTSRVDRGGSWWRDPVHGRSARRGVPGPSARYGNLGFRVARSLPDGQ